MHTDIKVGLSCNNRCIHCIMQPVKNRAEKNKVQLDAPLADILELINQAKRESYNAITLTGGELTLRDDVLEMVLHASSLGLHVTVQTNGRRLINIDLCALQRISDSIDFVIALHGSCAEIHDSITRENGSFRETLCGIRSVLDKGLRVTGKLVISCVNLRDITNTIDLMRDLGVCDVLLSFPHAEDFDEETFQQVVPRYSELPSILNTIFNNAGATSMQIELETIPYCQIPDVTKWRNSVELRMRIQELSTDMNTMIKMPMIGEAINWTESRKKIKAKGAACQRCFLDHLCEGLWLEYADHFGTSELIPITDQIIIDNFISSLDTN